MSELTKNFITEYKQRKFLEDLYKQNTIEFDNYFKYSGRIEEERSLISYWEYDVNHNANIIHEHFQKIKKDDKNND